MRKLSVFLQYM